MGLSLRNITKKIGQVASGVEAQVNPFDNGRTYNTVAQNRAPVPNTASFAKRYSPANIGGAVADTFTQPRLWQSSPKVNIGDFRGSGILEDFINSPIKLGLGATQIQQHQYKQGLGNIGAGALEGPIGLLPVGKGVQAARGVVGLGSKVLQGAKVGAKYGVGYGAVYGAADAASRNASYPDIAKSAALSGVTGGIGGAVIGGALPAVIPTVKLTAKGAVYMDNQLAAIQAKRDKTWKAHDAGFNRSVELYSAAKTASEKKFFGDQAREFKRLRDERFKEIKKGQGPGRLGMSTEDVSPPPPEGGGKLTPKQQAEANHQAMLKANKMTQNDYAAEYSKVQELERRQSQLHSEVSKALETAQRDATGKFTPAAQAMLKQKTDAWGKAIEDWNKLRVQHEARSKFAPLPPEGQPNVSEVPKGTFYKGLSKDGSKVGQSFGDNSVSYITQHKPLADSYNTGGGVKQFVFNKNAKVLDARSPEYNAIFHQAQGDTVKVNQIARKQGYDAVTEPNAQGVHIKTAILNPKAVKEVTQPTQGAKPKVTAKPTPTVSIKDKGVPSYEDFSKMIPAVKGVKSDVNPTITAKDLGTTKKGTQLAPPELNTAKNPFKSPIPEVKPGDYKQVISNSQTASAPTVTAGNVWQNTMRVLKKQSPGEYQNFWRHVEDPNAPKSPALQAAVDAWRNVDNRIHGTSQQLGGNTNYLSDHGLHPWDLPPEYAKHITNGGNPENFAGLHSLSRKYRTIAEGEAAGLKLTSDPLGEGSNYINASAALLRRRAIMKGVGEADGHIQDKTHHLDLGGETIPISQEAQNALRGLQKARYTNNKAAVGLRTVNQGLKTSILSLGQFHPINISVMRAGPSIAMAGHPIRAIKGVAGTFSATKGRVADMYASALKDTIVDHGTGQPISIVDAAAKIGAPYAQKGYDTAGSSLKGGVGHKLVFEQQIPMMHDQVVRSVLSDLEKKGVPLDSAKAREAGVAANSTMGFINKEALNLPPAVRKGMGDWMLASQFTPSKAVTLSKVAKGGVAGKYARADVVSNVAAATAIIVGVGYLLGQKSDNLRDSLLRALVNPAAPSSQTDKKGNNIEYRIPLTYTGEISHLLGIKLKRQADGHLGVDWKPKNAPDTALEWARSRLSPLASTAVKLKTNTNFANKPLYDPNAPLGTKAIQAGTTIGQGLMPIGTQGLLNTKIAKDHAPGSARDILEANTPGSNPLVKSALSSVGFSPRTDQTIGKARETANYFDAVGKASSSLKGKDKQAFDLLTASKKNPVTGKIDSPNNILDSVEKADILLNRPNVFNALRQVDKQGRDIGQPGNPIFDLSNDQLQKVLVYRQAKMLNAGKQTYDKQGNPLFTSLGLDEQWYQNFRNKEDSFYSAIGSSKSQSPQTFSGAVQPKASPDLQTKLNQYYTLPKGTGARTRFLRANPDILNFWTASDGFTNSERAAIGLKPVDNSLASGGSSGSSRYSYSSRSKTAPSVHIGLKKSSIPSPKVSVRKSKTKGSSIKFAVSKPKVSIKKSKV